MDIKISKLSKQQKQKADKIIELLLELEKVNVHPVVIDGGGGSGLNFVRCPAKDMWEFGEIILSRDEERHKEVEEFIYTPDKSCEVTIDYIAP